MIRTRSHEDIALVTGANKGIGRAVADALARLGMTVYLGARDTTRGRATADELARAGGDVRFVRLDVTDERSVEAAVRRIDDEHGRLDVLVNNAGTHHEWKPPSATPIREFQDYLDVNVVGVARMIRSALPLLRHGRAARVVNLSSVQGSLTAASDGHDPSGVFPDGEFPVLLSHSASKAAVNSLTVMYANELRPEGIMVNAVCPGYVATDATDHLGPLTPRQGAVGPVRLATLSPGGPTGTFTSTDADGTAYPLPW